MSDQLSAPRDPGSYARRRFAGLGFGAVALFGLACLAGGYGLARFGPDLYPDKPQPGASADLASAAPRAASTPTTLTAFTAPPPEAEPAADAGLGQRIEALESDRARMASAAASALAAGALVEAAQGSRPFIDEVKALAAIAPSLDLRALMIDAERGAPSRAALAASFPDAAAKAASAARAPGDGAGVLERVGYALSRVVALRRVGDVPGQGVDAIIARAERQVEDGDVVAALATLETLPADARDAIGPWRDRAERRAKIDREIAAVRAQALEELVRQARSAA